MLRVRPTLLIAGTLLVMLAVAAAVLAPYVYPEVEYRLHGPTTQLYPPPTGPVSGRWYDDYFLVEQVDPDTFAIGEPRYYQGNYSYLLLGTSRAVLFDAGTSTRSIAPVVRSLTALPVTVIPSHLHFDHVGALGRFDRTALIDDPGLRARTHEGMLKLERYEFLGFQDGAARFRVGVQGRVAPELDEATLRAALRGRSLAEARALLDHWEGLDEPAMVEMWPTWAPYALRLRIRVTLKE